MAEIFGCIPARIVRIERVRSPQGLATRPARAWSAPVIWKTKLVSGSEKNAFSTAVA